MIAHLRSICEREGVEADDDALTAAALAGDGSIRDSLSTLDQAIAAFGNKLEAREVRGLLAQFPARSSTAYSKRSAATIRRECSP